MFDRIARFFKLVPAYVPPLPDSFYEIYAIRKVMALYRSAKSWCERTRAAADDIAKRGMEPEKDWDKLDAHDPMKPDSRTQKERDKITF